LFNVFKYIKPYFIMFIHNVNFYKYMNNKLIVGTSALKSSPERLRTYLTLHLANIVVGFVTVLLPLLCYSLLKFIDKHLPVVFN
ncbi:MAG: hypothetical protein ACYDEC_11225, partial [Bacteroidia bacterium]